MAIENLQPLTYAVISIAFSLGTSSFLIRLYCRAAILKSLGWDDVVSLFLLIVNVMQQAILYIFLHYGCGKHAVLLSLYDLEQIVKWLFIEEIFYMFVHWTTKQTFLLFYLRLSPSVTFRWCIIGVMALNIAFTITNWLLAILQCTPFDSIFHPENYPDAKCIDKNIMLMTPSALNIVTDILILGLPIPVVWNLQMPLRRKIAVIAVISFGAFSVIIAACRFIILRELATAKDVSYTLGKMVIVAALEIQCAIIAVNLPSMKALWTKMTGGSSTGQSGPMGTDSKGYKLSSMKRRDGGSKIHWSKRSKSGFVPDSITHHIGAITASESEEELWQNGQQDRIHVTRVIEITTSGERTSQSTHQMRN